MSLQAQLPSRHDKLFAPQYIQGLHKIVSAYDGFIIDLWGVIHDGEVVFPHVIECLQQIKQTQKSVVFLSNSPRRAYAAKDKLHSFGIGMELYLDLWTSGEEVFHQLQSKRDPWYENLGTKCYHLGARIKGCDIFEELDLTVVEDIAQADFIINTGPLPQDKSVESYRPLLEIAQNKYLPMICANPDRFVIHGGIKLLCAGSLSEFYQNLGGDVREVGKPYGAVYQRVRSMFGDDVKNILAIGDALVTDIRGANNAEIDSLLVASGLHGRELPEELDNVGQDLGFKQICLEKDAMPNYIAKGFCW